jgi:hypothetical protein
VVGNEQEQMWGGIKWHIKHTEFNKKSGQLAKKSFFFKKIYLYG